MSIVPRGIYSGAVDALMDMLGGCASVQSLLQAPSAAATKEKIVAFGEASDLPRPNVLVNFANSARESSSRGHFIAGGKLLVQVEIPLTWKVPLLAIVAPGVYVLGAVAGFADSFFLGFEAFWGSDQFRFVTDNAGDQVVDSQGNPLIENPYSVVTFGGTVGEITLNTLPAAPPNIGDTITLALSDINDKSNFAMNVLGDIQADLETVNQDGALNIHAIRLNDYGRMLPDQDGEYFGAALEIDFGV